MPKAKAKRIARKKGEPRKARVQKLYAFDVERARKLRDEDYKGKDNTIALTLRGLIEKNKEVLTFEQIADAAKSAGVKRADRNTLPMKLLKKSKVLKPTKETAEVKSAPTPKSASTQKSAEKPKKERKAKADKPAKAKRVRKPKVAKKAAVAEETQDNEDAARGEDVAETEVEEALASQEKNDF